MNLRPYQEEGRDFLAERRYALLADEMRVGKTPQAILAAEQLCAEDIIVVCPAIAIEHWRREWCKWWPQCESPPLVVSYDWLRRNWPLNENWDLVIVDECHFAKNPEAQRTKLIYGKEGVGQCTDRMWVLSGTPAPKHAAELWPMLRAFGVVGTTYQDFVYRYCTINELTGRITGTQAKMIPELRELLGKIMLRRTRREVAPEMPAIDYQMLEVTPVAEVDLSSRYRSMSDAELLRSLEFAPTADRDSRIEVAAAKALPLVENIAFAIENGLLKQTVVFGWHLEPIYAVATALDVRGINVDVITGATSQAKRVVIQDEFRRGKTQVLAANILAAGTAIDLSAASHGYFLEMDWVPGNNAQAANRLISMEKNEPVTFDIATWPGSVDDRVQQVLLRRTQELSRLY